MLPVRLELRNFLAYHEPAPISFEGLNLACLSGPNGAGKSSLLDAMTWALWGRARTQSDDDLIYMGYDEMSVTFTFRQDHTLHRVERHRTKKGRGRSDLQLETFNEESNLWTVNTEASIRDTQTRITQLLRLDYETFIHSAFLVQGKADNFTVATSHSRKKILAEILGLGRWEQYETQTKEQLRQVEEQLNFNSMQIADIEKEETQESALRDELAVAKVECSRAEEARIGAEQLLAEVSSAPQEMKNAEKRLALIQQQIRGYERDMAALNAELAQQRDSLARYQQIVATRETIEEGFGRLESARQVAEELGDKLSQQGEIKDQLNELQRQLDAERAELESQANVYDDRIREAEQAIASGVSIEAELDAVNVEIDRLDKRKAERESVQVNREELRGEETALRTLNDSLKTEMNDILKRLEMVKAADGAVCPVCGQELDEQHRAELVAQYQSEGKTRGDTHRANKARTEEIARSVGEFDRLLREIDADLRGFDGLASRQGGLHERWMSVQQAVQRLDVDRTALEDLQRTLAEDNFGHELRQQVARLTEEIDRLGYDRDVHSEAREALRSLNGFEAQMRELAVAVERVPDLEARIQNVEARHEQITAEHGAACTEAVRLEKEVEDLRVLVREAQLRLSEVKRLHKLEQKATEDRIVVEQKLKAIEDARKRKADLTVRRDALLQDQTVYEQLREAFGKNGIPAMIIEAAIPELEEATNKLLTRMTDGRMYVRFDTQKANKSNDGVRETLDIVISDELGTRDYSLFSGGEGFRVNFALRIALSQFLARRAGARLQTLVIDEGFGSQDDIGRERLVEAINAIRGDFDLILIVTHFDDLRDAFPVHIEVRKTPKGSMVTIV